VLHNIFLQSSLQKFAESPLTDNAGDQREDSGGSNGGRHNGLMPRVCILLAFYGKETKWRPSQWPRATCLHPPRFLEKKQNGGQGTQLKQIFF
jgi:hypothetical protein